MYQITEDGIKTVYPVDGAEAGVKPVSVVGTTRAIVTLNPHRLERGTGIEPIRSPWQGDRLPLHHPRKLLLY